MRLVFSIFLVFLSILELSAQEEEIAYNYKLITAINTEGSTYIDVPSSLLVTPDKKYLLASTSGKRSQVYVYDINSGKLVKEIAIDGPALFRFLLFRNCRHTLRGGKKENIEN